MIQEKPLSINDIAQELNLGTATLKFILKRFSPWLPFDCADGQDYYSRNTIPILINIKASLDEGMLPSEIDRKLKNPGQADDTAKIDSHCLKPTDENLRVTKEGLNLIKSLIDEITTQQKRIATAHEKRALAEEKKAMAMNNIANALLKMNQLQINDSQTKEMALQASQVLTQNEANLASNLSEELANFEQQDISGVFDSSDPPYDRLENSKTDMDDLTDLIKGDVLGDTPFVDAPPPPEKMKANSLTSEATLDDLYSLIDQEELPRVSDQENIKKPFEIDNQAKILDDPKPRPGDIDNLSILIEKDSNQALLETEHQTDDLSLLIDNISSVEIPQEMDDLSVLNSLDFLAPTDDLSALIAETPSLKPDITPKKNLKKHKAAVLKTIIRLKTEGLSAEESTNRLNQDGVQTISGKSKWSKKVMSQIYKFIDSAK
ncbi:hypothetical protein [Desulfobacula sp.]|uniref:hypothetical protein n=1 Tax=Desulfobacula sp. TaxID=2593537 RepID=UPI0026272BBA|nr:hypothetical protein [Desulfobacula sp.]